MRFCAVQVSWIFYNETGIQKVEFKSSFSPGFHPVGDWNSEVELKSSLSGV